MATQIYLLLPQTEYFRLGRLLTDGSLVTTTFQKKPGGQSGETVGQ